MIRKLLIVAAVLFAGPVLGQTETPTQTNTPTQTRTPTRTPTHVFTATRKPTNTKLADTTATQTPTMTVTPAREEASHVHALELTLLPTDAQAPHHADLCISASYNPTGPNKADTCRCVLYVMRTGGTNYLKAKCPNGVAETIDSW